MEDEKPDDLIVTHVTIPNGDMPWLWIKHAAIIHRRDLSDLGEPYLSAVRSKRAWVISDLVRGDSKSAQPFAHDTEMDSAAETFEYFHLLCTEATGT